MRILKPKLNSKSIRRIMILGLSLIIIAFAIAPKPERLPGKVAGIASNPLLIENKFCTDPSSPNQLGCTSFVSSALAQAVSIYQNVTGPVYISGLTGIGTASPDQKLTIKNGGIGFDFNSSDKKLYSPADGDLEWMTHSSAGAHGFAVSHQGTKYVYLNISGNSYLNGGNVGIGTASPVYKLDVGGDIRANGGWLRNNGPQGWYNDAYGSGLYMIDGSWIRSYGGAGLWFNSATIGTNGNLSIGYGGASGPSGGAIIAGNVGIGTGSPGYKLDVRGDIRSTGTIRANANGTSYLCGGDDACLNDVNIANTVGIRGVQNNGWGSVNAAAFNVQSSRRFKTNIRNSRYGLDAVLALQGVDFSYIDPNQAQNATGFIAEDVAGIYPYAVQYDNNGLASSLDYSKFAPLFVNAIKEQQKQIRSLLDIVDIVNKIGHFLQIETQKLIVNGVDILDKLNKQEQEINELKSTVQQLQQQLQNK